MKQNRIFDRSWVEIDLDAFRSNLKILKSLLDSGQNFMQIVKADAYGHGALQISKAALAEGAALLGVANLEEGKLLRLQGIESPILVLSPALASEVSGFVEHQIMPSISDPEFALRFNQAAQESGQVLSVHIKLDTGMHRSGALDETFTNLAALLPQLKSLSVEGVFSHFAASESDPGYSLAQERCFHSMLKQLPFKPRFIHISNSSAVAAGLGKTTNLVRLGILSYGIKTNEITQAALDLKPVMTFKANLSQIKRIGRGEPIGYNLSWKAQRDSVYGILPIGYADGYEYLLGNKASVLLRNQLCPVIGRISMDMITVDLTDIPEAGIGDEVTLLGDSVPDLRAEQLSSLYGGSAYELLCQVGRRAKRYYFQDQQLESSAPLSRRDFVPGDFSDNKLSAIIEAAVSKRLGSDEIGSLVYREMLSNLFFDRDQDIHYRRNFKHSVEFRDQGPAEHWKTHTSLSFSKILDNDYFLVVCANREDALSRYFQRRDVEYRWLMDENFGLTADVFSISSIRINKLELETTLQVQDGCLEIRCTHPSIHELVGQEVDFVIDTDTLYPRKSHQLSVFITELTLGVSISFRYPQKLSPVECIPIYSGQNRYPELSRTPGEITVQTSPEQGIFPMSGVVFAY